MSKKPGVQPAAPQATSEGSSYSEEAPETASSAASDARAADKRVAAVDKQQLSGTLQAVQVETPLGGLTQSEVKPSDFAAPPGNPVAEYEEEDEEYEEYEESEERHAGGAARGPASQASTVRRDDVQKQDEPVQSIRSTGTTSNVSGV
ncbi:hypothetical protein DIPPA_18396 [Diplonema papillatum]|nr:hypothetical protein DIPPA_18396 [Diplonema papillatum]